MYGSTFKAQDLQSLKTEIANMKEEYHNYLIPRLNQSKQTLEEVRLTYNRLECLKRQCPTRIITG